MGRLDGSRGRAEAAAGSAGAAGRGRWILLVAALMVLPAAWAVPPPFDQMTDQEFERLGLNRLTAEELADLAAWLRDQQPVAVARDSATPNPPATAGVVRPGAAPSVESGFGAEHLPEPELPPEAARSISARIKGEFSGWTGNTLFYLDNGQVWQQRVRGRYRTRLENPEIVIEKGRFGYYLTLADSGRGIGVKRIR